MIAELITRMASANAPLPTLADRDVTEAELTALLGAARVAPSADNLQTWRFVVVRSAPTREALAAAAGSVGESLVRAPVVIVACGLRHAIGRVRREQPFVLVDVPIAVSHMLLQATEIGLAGCWTLALDEDTCSRAVGLPADARPIAVIALGWPAEPLGGR